MVPIWQRILKTLENYISFSFFLQAENFADNDNCFLVLNAFIEHGVKHGAKFATHGTECTV